VWHNKLLPFVKLLDWNGARHEPRMKVEERDSCPPKLHTGGGPLPRHPCGERYHTRTFQSKSPTRFKKLSCPATDCRFLLASPCSSITSPSRSTWESGDAASRSRMFW
jgi:hypothetical protein